MAKDLDPTSSMSALFGTRLKRLRERAGLTQEQAGRLVHVVGTRISQLERGTGHKPTLELTRALDELLDSDQLLVELLPYVLRESLPDWTRRFMELAEQATVICGYEVSVLPGLLQTEDYARDLMRYGFTLRSPEQLEERVAARMSRQARLSAPDGPEFWAILDESTLLRPIGGDVVMRAQLEHLLRVAEQPNITIQVLPFCSAGHGVVAGSLTLLTLPDGSQVAYTEGARSGQLLEEPAEVQLMAAKYDRLRALALPPALSAKKIRSLCEDAYRDPRIPSQAQRRRLAQVQLQQSGRRQLRRGSRRSPRRDTRP